MTRPGAAAKDSNALARISGTLVDHETNRNSSKNGGTNAHNGKELRQEARDQAIAQLNSGEIPVLLEHRGDPIGYVESAKKTHAGAIFVTFVLGPRDNSEAKSAADRVLARDCCELSLCHEYRQRANDDGTFAEQGTGAYDVTVREISLTEEGARKGCWLHEVELLDKENLPTGANEAVESDAVYIETRTDSQCSAPDRGAVRCSLRFMTTETTTTASPAAEVAAPTIATPAFDAAVNSPPDKMDVDGREEGRVGNPNAASAPASDSPNESDAKRAKSDVEERNPSNGSTSQVERVIADSMRTIDGLREQVSALKGQLDQSQAAVARSEQQEREASVARQKKEEEKLQRCIAELQKKIAPAQREPATAQPARIEEGKFAKSEAPVAASKLREGPKDKIDTETVKGALEHIKQLEASLNQKESELQAYSRTNRANMLGVSPDSAGVKEPPSKRAKTQEFPLREFVGRPDGGLVSANTRSGCLLYEDQDQNVQLARHSLLDMVRQGDMSTSEFNRCVAQMWSPSGLQHRDYGCVKASANESVAQMYCADGDPDGAMAPPIGYNLADQNASMHARLQSLVQNGNARDLMLGATRNLGIRA